MSYCSFARKRNDHHREHHDTEHGFPPIDDDDLFRRLMLEISQAGLSFDIALKKKEGIYDAFSSVEKIARMTEKNVQGLMKNPGIIRNRQKILAAIHNAKQIKGLQKEFGSFRKWLDAYHPQTKEGWTALFREKFKFTGGEIVNELMMSIGYLPGAHDLSCPMHQELKSGIKYRKRHK